MLEPGDLAPTFTLPDQNGQEVTLDELRGQPVLLYFYPRDATPGCTTQACDIRDRWAEFDEHGIHVLGISPDTVDSHASFRADHDLPHTLLADPEHEVMAIYGAWGEKTLYGKTSIGPIRSSVLIDKDGRILKTWKRAQARQHADHVLNAARQLLA